MFYDSCKNNVNSKQYGFENKCYDSADLSGLNLFLDVNDQIYYRSCKNNINERKYAYIDQCYTYEYLLSQNYYLDEDSHIFYIHCTDNNNIIKIYEHNNKCYTSAECINRNLFLDQDDKICYDDCNDNVNDKKYGYNNICYSLEDLPEEAYLNPITDENNCENLYYVKNSTIICVQDEICPNDYPYLKIGTKECRACPVTYRGECFDKCPDGTCIDKDNLDICVTKSSSTEVISGYCIDDFSSVLNNFNSLITRQNAVISKSPSLTLNMYSDDINLNQAKVSNPDLAFIDLGACGDKLKVANNLNPNEKLYILSIDATNKISNQAINSTSFKIYLADGTELTDLSACNETPISISLPITDLDLINFKEAEIFNSQGYDIYDINSDFYTDKCTAASMNGDDIILADRLKEIYPKNISLCPSGCSLNMAEFESKRLNCSCSVAYASQIFSEISDEELLNIQSDNSFTTYVADRVNYKVFFCYIVLKRAVFTDYLKNIGFYISFLVIIGNIIGFILFNKNSLLQIRLEMFKEIPDSKRLFDKMLEQIKKNKENKEDIKTTNNPPRKKIK